DGAKDSNNSWFPINNPSPSAREGHTSVWIKTSATSKMLMWGGAGPSGYLSDGYLLDDTTLNWSEAIPSAPGARAHHTAVVNGSQMIIWGGDTPSGPTNTGAVFDASTM